jgi:hypothetical protein
MCLQQEAGLLLWYHCHRGEDGQTEVAAAGVINSCLATLNNQDATTADKSIAAGLSYRSCCCQQAQAAVSAFPASKSAPCRAAVVLVQPGTCKNQKQQQLFVLA